MWRICTSVTFICFCLHHADIFSFSSFYKNEINCSVIHAGKRKFFNSVILLILLCCTILDRWYFSRTKFNMAFYRIYFFSFHSSWTSCTFFLLFQVAWIWHQLQGSELLGKSFQASMKNCFKIYRTCLIHLGIWQNIVMSLTVKTCSPLLFPCFLLSKKTLHSFMKVKAEIHHLLLAKENQLCYIINNVLNCCWF